MNRTLQQLRSDAGLILALIDQQFPFSAGPEERSSLARETGRVLHKLEAIDQDFLSIGLLGGTGVGKSTLMNALAGAEIASAGHRRPLTRQVLVYRHKEAEALPTLGRVDLEWREITHETDAIRRVLLCDLPDFDSILAENRERVARFLEHLDMTVWVTSPEKYGDMRFYEFLDEAPKARPNFIFVLNKGDLFFEEAEPEEAYERLSRTTALFRKHLAEHGVEDPLLYTVSARTIRTGGIVEPWNQFPLFKQQVFQLREIKEIRGIRSANLDVELRAIFSVLEREALPLQSMEQLLASAIKQMEARQSSWLEEAGEAISRWLAAHWESTLLEGGGASALMGPGQAIELLISNWPARMADEKRPAELLSASPAEGVLSLFRTQVEEVRDGVTRQMLVQGLPAPLLERADSVLNPSGRVEGLRIRLEGRMSGGLSVPSFTFRWFKFSQFMTYGALLLLFLVAIGGRESWRELIMVPGWRSGLNLVLSWVNTLFSAQGLAALGSYLLINLYLGLRFFRRRKRAIKRVAERAVRRNRDALLAVWEKDLATLREELKAFQEDIRAKIAFLKGG